MFHSKNRFLSYRTAAMMIFAAGAFSTTSVQAQSALAAKDAPKIDAAAKEILDKMVAVYQAAPSYAGDLQIQTTGFPDSFGINARLAFARPNRFHIFSQDTAGSQKITSDGAMSLYTISREPTSYLRGPAPAGKGAIKRALAPIGADGTALATLLSGSDPLAGFGKLLQAVSLGEATQDMDVVMAEFAGRGRSGSVTYFIGKEDRILYRAALSQTANGKTLTSTETHRDVKIGGDLPASTFAADAPAGMQQVEKFAPTPHDPRLKVGGKPFDLVVADMQGKAVSWEDYKGKVVLVDFWATWCPPCREEVPDIVRAYNTHKDEGFDIVGVSLDNEPGELTAFTQQYKMPWRQIFDRGANNQITDLYAPNGIPFTMLVGRDGKIVALGARGTYLTQEIKKALLAKAPATGIVPQAEVLPQATEVTR